MNTLNHLATGSLTALLIESPLIGLPVALASHFVLDSLPHFGYPGEEGYKEAFRHRLSYFSLLFDFIGIVLLVLMLQGKSPYVYIAALVALLPDLMWPIRYFGYEIKNKKPPTWKIAKFHVGIQWCERQWGIIIEVIFSIVILSYIRSIV